MNDALYVNLDLIELYDRLNTNDQDLRFYVSLIGTPPQRLIDIGSGTGMFTLKLADQGFQVTGVEPASAMVDYAKSLDHLGKARWIKGDARSIPSDSEADVVIMMGHAFQCLLEDNDLKMTLAKAKQVLVPGGRFMFESRNPLIKPWQDWTPELSAVTAEDKHGQPVKVSHNVIALQGDKVTFETMYQWPTKTLSSQSTLRFLNKDCIQSLLQEAGFTEIKCYGDWCGRAFSPTSPEMIFEAR